MKKEETADQLLSIRKNMQQCILQNPNYFGTIADAGLNKIYKPVYEIRKKNYFEQLGHLSYNPVTEKLSAVVTLKHAYGYLGTPCNGGSREYVRFYVDYSNTGSWIDEGAVSLGVYDHKFEEELFYDVELKLAPKIRHYHDKASALPRIRAILSWNMLPPVNRPDWNVIWGDVKEGNVHINQGKDSFCLFSHLLDLKAVDKMQVQN